MSEGVLLYRGFRYRGFCRRWVLSQWVLTGFGLDRLHKWPVIASACVRPMLGCIERIWALIRACSIVQRCRAWPFVVRLWLSFLTCDYDCTIQRVQALADISRSAPCCHSNESHAPIANPPNSAQLDRTPYHPPKLHPDPCSSVGMRRGTDSSDTQTDTQMTVTNIHFAWATPHAKCNNNNMIMIMDGSVMCCGTSAEANQPAFPPLQTLLITIVNTL